MNSELSQSVQSADPAVQELVFQMRNLFLWMLKWVMGIAGSVVLLLVVALGVQYKTVYLDHQIILQNMEKIASLRVNRASRDAFDNLSEYVHRDVKGRLDYFQQRLDHIQRTADASWRPPARRPQPRPPPWPTMLAMARPRSGPVIENGAPIR